jgi:hypothetical protein
MFGNLVKTDGSAVLGIAAAAILAARQNGPRATSGDFFGSAFPRVCHSSALRESRETQTRATKLSLERFAVTGLLQIALRGTDRKSRFGEDSGSR